MKVFRWIAEQRNKLLEDEFGTWSPNQGPTTPPPWGERKNMTVDIDVIRVDLLELRHQVTKLTKRVDQLLEGDKLIVQPDRPVAYMLRYKRACAWSTSFVGSDTVLDRFGSERAYVEYLARTDVYKRHNTTEIQLYRLFFETDDPIPDVIWSEP